MVGVSRQDIEFAAKTEQWKSTSSTTKTGIPFITIELLLGAGTPLPVGCTNPIIENDFLSVA
jgi:hypothetical protein